MLIGEQEPLCFQYETNDYSIQSKIEKACKKASAEYDFFRGEAFIVGFYCKDLKLAIEIDGITHEDEDILLKDKIRQEELETFGVAFLRFHALLVVDKVEAVVREIKVWIEEFEKKQWSSEIVLRKRVGK